MTTPRLMMNEEQVRKTCLLQALAEELAQMNSKECDASLAINMLLSCIQAIANKTPNPHAVILAVEGAVVRMKLLAS